MKSSLASSSLSKIAKKAHRQTFAPSEREIQKSILDWLQLKGIFAWKASSTGIYDQKRGAFRKNPHTAGVADIIGIIQGAVVHSIPGMISHIPCNAGVFLAIEVKAAKGKLSIAQQSFRDAVRLNGGLWIEARSLEDVIKALE